MPSSLADAFSRSGGKQTCRDLDRLEWLAVSYLFLPIFPFLLGWLRWPYGLSLAALAALGWWSTPWKRAEGRPVLGRPAAVVLVMAAAIWVALSGLVPPFDLSDDWSTRMAVLRDLAVGDWPVGYGQLGGAYQNLLLRFPMGYYLVPAMFAKGLGGTEGVARALLLPWTLLGVTLFLVLTLTSFRPEPRRLRVKNVILPLVLTIGFGGMDVVGWLVLRRSWPPVGSEIEWWAGLFQYSAHTTLLFWVPNHALPGWLAGVLVWRHRQQGLSLSACGLLLVAVVGWSPLVALGLTPLILACSLRGQPPRRWLEELWRPGLLALVPPGLIVTLFLTFRVPGNGLFMSWVSLNSIISWVLLVGLFTLLEWALLIAWIVRAGERSWLLWLAGSQLLILPLFKYGIFNDLVMRGGIPALTVVFCALLATLNAQQPGKLPGAIGLVLMLALGGVTPFLALQQSFQPGDRYVSQGRTYVQINAGKTKGIAWHYLADLHDTWLERVLAAPKRLSPGPLLPSPAPSPPSSP